MDYKASTRSPGCRWTRPSAPRSPPSSTRNAKVVWKVHPPAVRAMGMKKMVSLSSWFTMFYVVRGYENIKLGSVETNHRKLAELRTNSRVRRSVMGSAIFALFLPIALGLVMLGLGLTLTVADFSRVLKYPKATVVALLCQILLLPAICLGLIVLFGLTGVLAVGMMLLVASPGGTTSNLFSHLAGGDVALNITLTAINSVLAVFTLPVVVGLSVSGFTGDEASIGIQPGKFVQVFAIVLIPVAIGMWVRHRFTGWAQRMRQPVKIVSVIVLVLVIAAATAQEFQTLLDNIGRLGLIALLLCVLSLTVGYCVPRLFRVTRRQSIASAMEIGLHNATLAITVAVSVLGNETLAIPGAIYGVVMFVPAAIGAYLLSRHHEPAAQAASA
jgi:BASS family bile acid:Na+ symporter